MAAVVVDDRQRFEHITHFGLLEGERDRGVADDFAFAFEMSDAMLEKDNTANWGKSLHHECSFDDRRGMDLRTRPGRLRRAVPPHCLQLGHFTKPKPWES